MQRYQINFRWLIGVIVGSFVLFVIAFFVQRMQVSSKAGYFLQRADAAEEAGDTLAAYKSLRKYVQLRPKENETRIRMAKLGVEIMNDPNILLETRQSAYRLLDQTVRRTQDLDLRLALAESYLPRRAENAVELLNEILDEDPDNPKACGLLVRALYSSAEYEKVKEQAFKFIGYDTETEQFDRSKSLIKDEPEVYALLADVLSKKDKQTELATRVIEEMILATPESAQAHLRKSNFQKLNDDLEGAATSLEKAYQLDPKNSTILSHKGSEAYRESFGIKPGAKDSDEPPKTETEAEKAAAKAAQIAALEKSKMFFAAGLEADPKNPHFYRMLAQVEHALAENPLEKSDAALGILNLGIDKLDKDETVEIGLFKIELLLNLKDFDGVREEVKRLRNLNHLALTSLLDFQNVRIKNEQKKWIEVTRELVRLRPRISRKTLYRRTTHAHNYHLMASMMLGRAYLQQGINDLAIQTYTEIINDYPNNVRAKQILTSIDESIRPNQSLITLERMINETLELPLAEQNWDKVDAVVQQVIANNNLGVVRQNLLAAKILAKRGKYDAAKSLITAAIKESPNDTNVWYSALLLVLSEPGEGPAKSMQILNKIEKKWGVTLRSLAQRADLLTMIRPATVSEDLKALLVDGEHLKQEEVSRLYKVLGQKFEQLRMYDEAIEMLSHAAERQPDDLPVRMTLFEIALRKHDHVAMKKAQKSILTALAGDKDDPSYLLNEAKTIISSMDSQNIDRKELLKARNILDQALTKRPKWHELHITYGYTLLMLGDNSKLALQHFDLALETGPAKPQVLALQVRQLAKLSMHKEARKRMEKMSSGQQARLLGLLQAEIFIQTGDAQKGLKLAAKLAAEQPNNPTLQQKYSKMAHASNNLDVAISALKASLVNDSSNPGKWIRLIGLQFENGDRNKIEGTMRQAHLACDVEHLSYLTAKYFELQSRWHSADVMYQSSFADRLYNLDVAHQMANSYLLWAPKNKVYAGKAAVFINRILRAANEGKAKSDNPHVAWARLKAARILYSKNDYQQSLRAERLLRETDSDYVMTHTESELLTDILIARADPRSLLKAKKLLLKLQQEERLPLKSALQLVHILSQSDQWNEAKDLLLELIAQHSSKPIVWINYVNLLIDHGDYSLAESRLNKLKSLDKTNRAIVPLSIRLASKRGDQVLMNRLLRSLMPNMRAKLEKKQLAQILEIAHLATRYKDYEFAEQLYSTYAKYTSDEGEFQLAKFHAYHGDCERALTLMKQLYPARTDDIVQLANRMLAARRSEVGDKYDTQVDRLIDAGLREDPDSITRQLARAESYEVQGKHKQSIAAYDNLLKSDDLKPKQRAAAMNNLGFQLALVNQRLDDAEQLVTKAMETFGPVEDMLDTRALVRMEQKKYDLAIEDMELAVSTSRDPVKHFHLAKAYILAGKNSQAVQSWEKAQSLGFESESLPKLEQPQFDDILKQIENSQK